jgi:flagella basal body P-ring formation protein FlgA
MSHTNVAVIVLCGVLVVGSATPAGPAAVRASDGEIVLQVHLPREITIRDRLLNLGQVAVVRGSGTLVAKARAVAMGQFSMPGQKVVLDRATILSRLASSGISSEQVRLTGADAVTVRRDQAIVETQDFLEISQQFLTQNAAGFALSEITPLARPKSLVLAGQPEDVQLKPQFVRSTSRGLVTVQVQVVVDGKEIGSRDIPFRLKYECHRVLTATDIAEGAALTPENVKIEKKISDRPEPAGWKPPYGLVATRALAANTEITQEMIGQTSSSVLVRRNETVVIHLERPGLTVTAVGTALQEARTGEILKVRNGDSRRVIVCKVMADGTVEPVL